MVSRKEKLAAIRSALNGDIEPLRKIVIPINHNWHIEILNGQQKLIKEYKFSITAWPGNKK